MLKHFVFLIYMSFFLLACNSDSATSDSLLQQPPFNTFTDSIQKNPKNADLYYKRGVLFYQNNHLSYAGQDLRQAWNLSPKEEYAQGVADVLSKKKLDSAIIFLQTALQQLPQSIVLKMSLAKNYKEKKDLLKALALCDDILSTFPNQLDALILKSSILKEQHKEAEALATLEKAYSYAPFDVELSYNLAFEYAQNKNPKALVLTDSLIKMDSAKTHAEPYYFKGLYYENGGNTALALQYLNEAIGHDYYFIDAYMEKGQLYYNQKKWEAALKTFTLAATVSPTFADAYYWIGKTEEAMNKKEEAALNYQRAYSLDKSLTEAKEAAERLK